MAFVAWRDFDARSILALGGPWTRNLEKLAAATRMELKADDIKPYAWPDGFAEEIDWDHLLAIVGTKLTIPNRTHIYATMWWNRDPSSDDTPLAVSVAFEPWYVVWRRKIMAVAQQLEGEAVCDEESQIWLQEDVSSDNIQNFEDLYDRIFSRWQVIFETLGGFPSQR